MPSDRESGGNSNNSSYYNLNGNQSYTNKTVSEVNKKLADSWKVKGNQSFKDNQTEEAIQFYTRAIELDPENSLYYTNRAFCYKRLQQWPDVVQDARTSLTLDDESVKGHYCLGIALIQIGEFEEGLKKLLKAKTLSSAKNSIFENEIAREILSSKSYIWKKEMEDKTSKQTALMEYLCTQLTILSDLGIIPRDELNQKVEDLQKVFKEISEFQKPFEPPNYLCCKISMSLMKDPVCTKSGVTYERELLLQHLKCNGRTDPLSRKPLYENEIFPNLAIREATQIFLEKNPWAFEYY